MAPAVAGVPLTFQPSGALSDSEAWVIACRPSLRNAAGTVIVCPGWAIWNCDPR
jgi:hypothetical protein